MRQRVPNPRFSYLTMPELREAKLIKEYELRAAEMTEPDKTPGVPEKSKRIVDERID